MRKFINVNIVECLTKIFNETTEEHKADFKFDMMHIFNDAQKAGEDGNPRHLLWMARRNGTWCVPEGNVYIRDAPENKIWCGYWNEPDGVNAFAVEVFGVRDNAAVGNVYELAYAEHVDWVSAHLFTARSAAVELPNGKTMNISMDEFNYYKLRLEHGAIAKITYVLNGDLEKYNELMAEIKRMRAISCEQREDTPK